MVGCRVALLDGTTFEPKGVDKGALGQVLFEKVTKHLDIIETDYFGITYRDKSGKKFWLDHSKKISKQVNGGTWVFEFQVKFYTPDPMSLKEDITRYQLCLQLRVDIFNGKLPCSFATYALLGSYTVQSEIGDWDPIEFGTGVEYLHDFDFAPTQNAELLEKIAELHKHHKGLTPTMAEAHFLENAKKLAMFGVDLHDAKDSENKDIQLGVCANGILVYKDRLRINRFVWPKCLKLSYKRNNFYVKVRPGEFEPHERTIMFRLENHKLAKRLWKTCVEHHAFFRLKETDPHNTDTLFPRFNTRFRYSGRTAHQARKAAEQVHRDEPHIARTAERRSLGHGDHKPRSQDGDTLQKRPHDESDMYDKKGDPNATAEMGPNANSAGLMDGRYQGAPSPLKENYMQLLAETPAINSQTPWKEAQPMIKKDPRYKAVPSDAQREEWYNEYQQNLVKANYMQLLAETPTINTQTRWNEAQQDIHNDPRYQAVPTDALREQWFDEYIMNLLKADYMQMLHDTPTINSQTPWEHAQQDIYRDPRYQAVPTDAQREQWYNEYQQALLKNDFMNLLKDTPAVTSNAKWSDAQEELKSDPRYAAVPSDAQREQWFNEYVQSLGPPPYSPGDGKKDKKSKEDEKKRKKEEERRRKEEEKERKRLEKEKKKQKGKPAETNLDGDQGDHLEQLKEDFTQLLRETPEVTSQSRLDDVKHKLQNDPRYKAVGSDDRREKWFNEYTDKMLKDDFMRLLMETPTINSQSTWPEARKEIDLDPRFMAVNSEAKREEWFDEYVQNQLKQDYMQLLKDTPSIHSQYTQFEPVKAYIEYDPRYIAVGNDAKREAWFDEHIQNLKKEEFMQLLKDTPSITSYSRYPEVREEIAADPRFNNVDSEATREEYFNEYIQNMKKQGYNQLLQDTPDITAYSHFHESKHLIDTDPRYHAVDTDLHRSVWFNQYVNRLAGISYGDGDFGLLIGNYKSIDRKLEFEPINPPKTTRKSPETMPFFEPVDDPDAEAKKRVPPPVAKKPRVASGYDSEEDRLLRNSGGVPVTVETETFKYSPDTDDMPKATSNIPIVETKTQKVTYEKDGVPYETEDSILISAHSVTTKSQTIDTTTYKTERDGMVETRVERKITVMSDGEDGIDHDALLRAAIEQVTNMNQSFEVEKIEYMRQIEDK